MGKRIGILGGTFNPIHNGHLILAEDSKEILNLDEVIFMPSGNPYMKRDSDLLDGEIRARMTELALEGNPYFSLSRLELERKGPTYTRDTIAQLKAMDPDARYYFLLGADNLLTLETWKDPAFIMQNCVIAVSVRGTGTEEKLKKIAAHLIYEYQADIRILPSRFIDISSSEIRKKIRSQKNVQYFVPEKVLAYIKEKGLYQSL